MKFVLGFLGILVIAIICLVVTSCFSGEDVDETSPEMNMADEQPVN